MNLKYVLVALVVAALTLWWLLRPTETMQAMRAEKRDQDAKTKGKGKKKAKKKAKKKRKGKKSGKTTVTRYSGKSLALGQNYTSKKGCGKGGKIWNIKGAKCEFPGEQFAAVHEKDKHLMGKRIKVTGSDGKKTKSVTYRIVNYCDKDDKDCDNAFKGGNNFLVDVHRSSKNFGDFQTDTTYVVLD